MSKAGKFLRISRLTRTSLASVIALTSRSIDFGFVGKTLTSQLPKEVSKILISAVSSDKDPRTPKIPFVNNKIKLSMSKVVILMASEEISAELLLFFC